MKFFTLTIPLLLITGLSAQAGKIYKWTDENGRVHYSQTAPKNKNAKAFNVRQNTSNRPVFDKKTKSEVKKKTTDIKKQNEKIKKQNEQTKAEAKKIKQENCKTLRQNIDSLNEGGRIFEMEDGKRKYLSDTEINKRKKESNEVFAKDCS